jgi:uncharacterized protein (UPF0248 family)
VALCVVLLLGAALLLRGVERARGEDRGFAVNDVTTIGISYVPRTFDSVHVRAFVTALARGLAGLPAADRVALSTGMPLASVGKSTARLLAESDARARDVVTDQISPSYFRVLEMPLLAGRAFDDGDMRSDVIVINEALARAYWTPETAVGRTLVVGRPRTIVGVVRDARVSALDHVDAEVYEPFAGRTIPNVLVRADAVGTTDAIAAMIRSHAPQLRLSVAPLSNFLDRQLAASRALGRVAGVLGTLALALATIGMFGVFAFWVQQRSHEIGVRMALGAQPVQVIALVLRVCMRASVVGLVVGLAGALAASRVLVDYLYGLNPLDPLAYGSVALILVTAGLFSAYVPTRRATRIDPVRALRCE